MYGPPFVTALSLYRPDVNAPVMDCSVVGGDGYPVHNVDGLTAVVVIVGGNFGFGGNTTVLIHDVPCTNAVVTHERIQCTTAVCEGRAVVGVLHAWSGVSLFRVWAEACLRAPLVEL